MRTSDLRPPPSERSRGDRSFDCAAVSRSEAATPLRMTNPVQYKVLSSPPGASKNAQEPGCAIPDFTYGGLLAQNSSRPISVHFAPAAIAAFQKIDAERIRAHVRFLSHDLLEGRGTGQRGREIAAEYIATQFALDGLKPAGDNGTYMQKVPMVGTTLSPETTFSLVPAKGSP